MSHLTKVEGVEEVEASKGIQKDEKQRVGDSPFDPFDPFDFSTPST
jgi:hypothetical protein